MSTIPETEGRKAFGANVQGYDESRPGYPDWIFDRLLSEKILHPAARTLEIGAGNGLATQKLVELGVSQLTLIEPDKRFEPLLSRLTESIGSTSKVFYEPFEDVELPNREFDLVVIATTFHWLDPATRIIKLAGLTKPGGHIALFWNVFQDLNLDDAFHEATKDMLSALSNSPSGKPDSLPFALDRHARDTEFLSSGNFETLLYEESHWQLTLDSRGVRYLYEGFSGIARLADSEREELLDRIESVAESEFGGRVVRNMTSPLYIFRRT